MIELLCNLVDLRTRDEEREWTADSHWEGPDPNRTDSIREG